MRKDIVCDSSALISLTDSCMASSLPFMRKKFDASLIITDAIEYECISHPLSLQTREYAFSALRIKNAVANNTITKVAINPGIAKKRDEMLHLANSMFVTQGRPITLVHTGEMEILALANELRIRSILMDERTTRLLIEAPNKIKEHFESEFHTIVMVNKENLDKFCELTKGMEVFRSSEFMALAYEAGYFDDYNGLKDDAYNAALYKLKYSGCSISYDEIKELLAS